jgi:hypothetical protein
MARRRQPKLPPIEVPHPAFPADERILTHNSLGQVSPSWKLTHFWEMLAAVVDLWNSYIVPFDPPGVFLESGGGERRLLAQIDFE